MPTYDYRKDTIAAVATATGKSGISIVRISGPDSLSVLKPLFRGKRKPEEHVREMLHGFIADGGEIIDEVLVVYMKAPRSYTGEDVVEIQCHGGHAAADAILEKATEHGARLAEPGEFTRRAFLNGRIDLVQAESVMEIVTAEGREHLRRAERLMDGAFSKRIDELLERLKHTMSLLELNIEFLHQGIEAVETAELGDSIRSIIGVLDTMITSYTTAKRIKNGLRVVLAGKVNAGKSSLFNTLLGRKRAIVNEAPGTTRDWLEERVEMDGLPVNLIDTAGIRETDDAIEREGVSVTERLLDDADIIVYLAEHTGHCPDTSRHLENRENVIRVLSKADVLSAEEKAESPPDVLPVSSLTGEGVPELRRMLSERARRLTRSAAGDSLVLVERHRMELLKAREALERALESVEHWSEEVTVLELKDARRHMESILGRNIELDVLDSIFNNFCIGK